MKKKMVTVLLTAAMVTAMAAGCGSKPAETEGTAATAATEAKTEAVTEGTEAKAADSSEESQEGDAKEENNAGGGKVGVSMPTKDLQRWNQDGENMKNQLEAADTRLIFSLRGMMWQLRFPR